MKKLLSILSLFVLFVCTIRAASVSLAWDPNSETNLAGYVIYYGTASGQYSNSNNVGNVTNTTVSGLLEGVTYYFVATAYDASGLESDPSNEVSYQVPTAFTPINFRITSLVTNNSSVKINFAWTSSTNSIVKIYALKGTNGLLSLTNVNVILAGSYTNLQSATVSNLSNGTWRFKANSLSPSTGITSLLTSEEPTTKILVKPSAPVGFKFINVAP